MKSLIYLTFWMTYFLRIITLIESARILAVIPIPSYSHQISYRKLWIALSQRGHEVVLITTDPLNDPHLTNFTEIDCQSNYKFLQKMDFVKSRYSDMSWQEQDRNLWELREQITVNILEHPEVRKIFAPNSGQKFDLVIAEVVMTPVFYVLGHRFNAPIIGVISSGLIVYHYYILGLPILTTHPSNWELGPYTDINMSLWQRIKNFVRIWHYLYEMLKKLYPAQQAIAEKYFGKDIPFLTDIEKNISIILSSEQYAISYVRPLMPNVVMFGNLHILTEQVALPKDLKQFLDDAPNGFIYLSLGTNVRMSLFPKSVHDIFRDVFANLPCKVIWKNDIDLPDKPDNVYVTKWLPQQTILAHPKIRLFIYQGGRQSTEEAVYFTVPLLALPVFADQFAHSSKMVSIGVAKQLDIPSISREELNETIMDMLNDKRYKERMVAIKNINEDQQLNSLENVIWWVEYVIRHKGASHLRCDISNYPWYKRYDLDVIIILSIAGFLILFCTLVILCILLKIIYKYCSKKPHIENKKLN